MSDLEFYNKQDKEELVSMCMARDNKINSLEKEASFYKSLSNTANKELNLLQDKYETLLAIEELNEEKIKRVACNLGHELYGHILQNDEETYNKEFYTNGKLDYKKLLIRLLEQTFETLEVDGKKWWDYEN
jgi:hypothetical protein